jgi:hypothetical protein
MGKMKIAYKIFVVKLEGDKPSGRFRSTWG